MQERAPFIVGSRFKAIRPFVMDGVAYGHDEVVDVSKVETRRVRQMYEAFFIEPVTASDAPVAKVEPIRPRREKAPAPEPAPAEAVAPGVPSLRYKGFGRYEVVSATGEVTGPMEKAEAERELAKLL
jgi:hypothetical protein